MQYDKYLGCSDKSKDYLFRNRQHRMYGLGHTMTIDKSLCKLYVNNIAASLENIDMKQQ